MHEQSRPVLIFRAIVLALAAFYAARMLVVHSLVDEPFGPFRWLTYWANLAALICAWLMLRRSLGQSAARHDGLTAATAVIGLLVVYLYWSLFFKDPLSVTTNGPGALWTEGYYHGLGPLLQWIDALFILRGFRAPARAAGWLLGIVGAWLALIELAVRPLNDTPAGSITSGLPYPFLNNMELADRLIFYGINLVTGLAVLALLTALAWLIRRLIPARC